MRSAIINYDQMHEVGNPDGICLAMQIHHQLKLTGRALLVGEDHLDRSLVTRLMCASVGNPYLELPSLKNAFDPTSLWDEFMRQAITVSLEAWTPVIIFIRISEIQTDHQWRDISSILQWGWVFHEFISLDTLSEASKNNMTNHGFAHDELDVLIDFIRSSRMIRLVLSHDMKESSHFFVHHIYKMPALRSTPSICISKWKHETIVAYSFNITRDKSTPWLNDFLFFVVELMQKLPKMEKDIGGVLIEAENSSIKTALSIFSDLLAMKGKELDAKISKLNQAVYASDKILAAVLSLGTEFEASSKRLVSNDHDTQEYLKTLEYERETRDRIAVEIQIIGDAAKRATSEYESLEKQYTSELSRVMPALESSSQGVDELKKSDIYEIRSMMSPPKGVLLVLECILHLFRVDMRGSDGIWELAKKLIIEPRFVHSVINFDKDTLTNTIMNRVGTVIKNQDFSQEHLEPVSKAVWALGSWVLSLKAYHERMSAFEPKKRLIQEQKSKCKYYINEVAKNQIKLDVSETALVKMKSRFDTVIKYKETVTKNHKEVQERFRIAQILEETIQICKDRYKPAVEELKQQKALLTTDSLLNACFAAYLGPYSKSVREHARKEMQEWYTTNEILFTEFTSLSHFYTKPHDIFVTNEIIPDLLNLDNAVIARLSKEIPLICEGYIVGLC
jgi:hypothetical protein